MREEFRAFLQRQAGHLYRQEKAVTQGYGNQRHPEESAFEAGYRAGALAMRERAALESLAFGGNPSMVRAIRALPVEE